jgi:REP element-mobilizing transposase RayT
MKLEVLENDKFYHIYNRGINGVTIFVSDENKRYFLKLYLKYLENKADTFAYCLMDNHFHFVIRVIKEEEIAQALSNLFNAYAKAFNKQSDRTGSLFEKHFKRIQIESQTYLTNLIQYVHLNPQHHLDIDYRSFSFSSYQSIVSDKPTKLVREEVLTYFGGVENFIYSHDFKSEIVSEKFTFE